MGRLYNTNENNVSSGTTGRLNSNWYAEFEKTAAIRPPEVIPEKQPSEAEKFLALPWWKQAISWEALKRTPQSALEVGKSMLQSLPRGINSLVISTPKYKMDEFVPTTRFEKILYGNDPITPAQSGFFSERMNKAGVNPKVSTGVQAGLTGAQVVADAVGIAGLLKSAVEKSGQMSAKVAEKQIAKDMVPIEDMGFSKKVAVPNPEGIKYNTELEKNIAKGIAEPTTGGTMRKVAVPAEDRFVYTPPREQLALPAPTKENIPVSTVKLPETTSEINLPKSNLTDFQAAYKKSVEDKKGLLNDIADFVRSEHQTSKTGSIEDIYSDRNLYKFVKNQGGIKPTNFFKGEETARMPKGLFNKNSSVALDEMATLAQDYGFPIEDTNDLINRMFDYNASADSWSSNPQWYKDLYKELGRNPGKKDIVAYIEKNIDNMDIPQGMKQGYYSLVEDIKNYASSAKKEMSDSAIAKYIADSEKIKKEYVGGGLRKEKVPAKEVFEFTPEENQLMLPGKVAEPQPEVKWIEKVVKDATSGATGPSKGAYRASSEAGVATRLKRLFTSGGAELNAQGDSGRKLTKTILEERINSDQLRGQYEVKLMEAMKGLSKKERILAGEIVDGAGQTNDPKILEAAQKLKALLDDIGNQAEASALEIKLPNGQSVPFIKRENYFPRKYNMDDLAKAKNREKLINHLVDSGQAKTYPEAEKLLDNFIKGHGQRKAGNLEYARTINLPGYEKDPMKAVAAYITSATKRLSEAKYFGKADDIAYSLIDQIRNEGGDYKYAQEVFDLMVGTKKYNNAGVNLATKFNMVTKLDLGAITNATQSVNTATKAGVLNTIDGILEAYFTPNKAGKFARSVGVIEDPLTMGKAEGLSMGKIMEKIMAPFSYIEKKNRTIAAVAGKRYTEQMAQRLLDNPENKLAIRQLESLGLDPKKIIEQGRLTEEDIFKGAKMTSDNTQFKVDAIDIPPGWKTNIGRLVSQFKSFSFKQGIFVRDEVLKEAFLHGNFLPMIRLVSLGVPASFLADSARNKLTGRDVKQEDKSLDIRKWDRYAKAIGTLPVDLATQGKFLADTYKNPYATDLKKVGRTVGSVAGPTAGEVFSVINAIEQKTITNEKNKNLAKGKQPSDPNLELKRLLSGYIPFAGEYIKNSKFDYPKDNVSDFTRVIRAVESNDQTAIQAALDKYKPRSRKTTLKSAQKIVEEQKNQAAQPQSTLINRLKARFAN